MKKIQISEKIKKIDISGIRKMFEQAKTMKDPIDLSLGLPDFDTPDYIKKRAIEYIESGKNSYTSTAGIIELRKKIAEKLKKENNINYDEENIIISSAVTGGLLVSLMTILNKGDEVLVFDPYFVLYKSIILQNDGIPVFVDTKEDFSMDLEDLEKKITKKSKVIIINSPNNPTGKVYSEKELKDLAKIAKKYDLTIISDEIYEYFIYNGKKHFSIGSVYEKTITLNGFSKSYAMSGRRIGYIAGPKDFIKEALKAQQFVYVCATTPFQYASIDAIGFDISYYVKDYEKRANFIYDELKNYYQLQKGEGAFYYFIKYPYEKQKFLDDCFKNNLIVVAGGNFSRNDDFFRISFSANMKSIKKAVEILKSLGSSEKLFNFIKINIF